MVLVAMNAEGLLAGGDKIHVEAPLVEGDSEGICLLKVCYLEPGIV